MINTEMNKSAWEFNAYNFWCQYNGTPSEFAWRLKKNPVHALRKHIEYMGDIKEKQIINPLGSNGRKAIPMAILGAEVKVVDISDENYQYAMELSEAAGVTIEYEVGDFIETDSKGFDIAYLEGGILHYFENIDILMNKIASTLVVGGMLLLDDSHPFRKVIKKSDGSIRLDGDYFDNQLHESYVAYANLYDGIDPDEFPKCLLRFYTIGEVITAISKAGFRIEFLKEYPRFDDFKNLPGNFIIKAIKE